MKIRARAVPQRHRTKKSYRTRTTFVTILVYAYHTCVTTTFRVSNICGALLKILLAKKKTIPKYTLRIKKTELQQLV